MTKSTMKAPFQRLKFMIMINKVLGLVSCKLMNGRLRPASVWCRCYCVLWILVHCLYLGTVYYKWYTKPPDFKSKTVFFLEILRANAFFVSLLPYHYVAVWRNRDFVKFSDKLEAYDDKATVLGHQRKDNHMFTWLYFVYTLTTLLIKTYYSISQAMTKGTTVVLEETFRAVPTIIGTYCVFITVIFLDLIRQRFRHLNKTIAPHMSGLPVTGSQGEITVYDVRYLHGVLIDSAELIDSLYGIGSLITFTSILLEFVSVLYLFIEDIDNENTMVVILDLSFQAVFLFAMYHMTAVEANRIEESVEEYGLSFQNSKCRMDKIEMILYFYHARFYFTAADFFILDLTIFLSIFSTVTTFLTIIV